MNAVTYVVFAVGFVLLILGARWLVDGALDLARRLGVSELTIGLTVVSVGTSLPELVVNVSASVHGNPGIAIGNILGSNIANILLILGVAAAIRPLSIRDRTIVSEMPICLAATLLVGFLANAALFSPVEELTLSRPDGLMLMAFFGLFLGYVRRTASEDQLAGLAGEAPAEGALRPAARIAGGSLVLMLGGELVVRGSLGIVESLGVSESLVGLTVVALGTSAPELAASASAAWRGNADVAVGNVIGSNVFNLLWVLGLSALIRPLPFDVLSNTDLLVVIASSALLLVTMAAGRANTIDRWEGWMFLAVYASYLGFVGYRG